MGDTPKLLGDRIRARREELGLNPVDLAKAAGVSISAVLQWESNKTKNLKLEYFFAIADFLKVEPRWLGLGKGRKEIDTPSTPISQPVFRRSIHYQKSGKSGAKRMTRRKSTKG